MLVVLIFQSRYVQNKQMTSQNFVSFLLDTGIRLFENVNQLSYGLSFAFPYVRILLFLNGTTLACQIS